ncbi:MAG: vitamin-B12 independent methionine synthase [Acidobacteria bacterium]|nr:vitamin-B12 independent methionine synthase [Acidobacteriota bacterium]
MNVLPLFPVTTVGSWPRPQGVLDAQRQFRRGRISREAFDEVADAAVREVVRLQEQVGCDIVTDGELRRDNFYSFVAHKLVGVRLMTLAEMLDIVEDKAGFERLLETLDVPAYAISTAACVGKIERREPLVVGDVRFLRRQTDRPVKATLPGPYLLTRAMFVAEATSAAYATKEDLADDVVRVLHDEVMELAREGVAIIQLDEPVLTEVAFAPGQTRTFMCGALAARKDPAEELAFAVSLINRVLDGVTGVRCAVHVCRGNWSRDETTLLRGSYAALAPYLDQLHVSQLVLEYATERAGDLIPFEGKELGLGVVNPRTDTVESAADIRTVIERALQHYAPERLFLNPDCGFGTFSSRPMNSAAVAVAKLGAMVEAARALRG